MHHVVLFRPSEITKTHTATSKKKSNSSKQNEPGMAQNILNGDIPSSPVHNGDIVTKLSTENATENLIGANGSSVMELADDNISDSESAKLLPNQTKTVSTSDSIKRDHQDLNSNDKPTPKRKKRTKKETRNKNEVKDIDLDPDMDQLQVGTLKPRFRCLQRFLNFRPGLWVGLAVLLMWILMVLLSAALIYGR